MRSDLGGGGRQTYKTAKEERFFYRKGPMYESQKSIKGGKERDGTQIRGS